MKSGKAKILISVLCLAAALSLAAFTVYAWFVDFAKVDANGVDSVITSGDVLSFEIDYYYTSSTNGKDFDIGKKINDSNAQKGTIWNMPQYTPSLGNSGATTTGVLLDMKITFAKAADYKLTAKAMNGKYPYNAEAKDGKDFRDDFDEYIGKNYLSNVIFLRNARLAAGTNAESDLNGGKLNVDNSGIQYNFITHDDNNVYFDGKNDEEKKNSSVDLTTIYLSDKVINEYAKLHVYYLMDYMPQQVNSMYTVMLHLFPYHARLDTTINFLRDIIFEIGRA